MLLVLERRSVDLAQNVIDHRGLRHVEELQVERIRDKIHQVHPMQKLVPPTRDRPPRRAERVIAQLCEAGAHRLDGLGYILVKPLRSFLV